MIVLRRYRNMPAALVEKSVLDAAGIECFLQDDKLMRMDWLGNAIDWIKLFVRESDAEEASLEQKGMRLFFFPRQVRAIGAIDSGKERVFAICVSPAEADQIERKAHGAGGLVTGDTGPSV